MVEGLSLEEVASRFKHGDTIRWRSSPSKKRINHQGVGTYEGTLNGKILVRYAVSTRYAMQKTTTIAHTQVLLDDPQPFPLADAG